MASLLRSVLSSVLAVLCWTATAAADPILAVYHVQVTGRMTSQSNPVFEPFQQDFTLLLRFDPTLATYDRSYGPAWFSPVPLPRVSPPPEVTLGTNSYTAHGQFDENPYGATNLFAVAAQHTSGSGGLSTYFSTTRLITNIPIGDLEPVFTAETFMAHLVLGSPINFDFGTTLFGPLGQVERLEYQGYARLIEVRPAEPIPEPATLGLIGGGLLMLLRRRRRLTTERAAPAELRFNQKRLPL